MPKCRTSTDTVYIEHTATDCPYCYHTNKITATDGGNKVRCTNSICRKLFIVGYEDGCGPEI